MKLERIAEIKPLPYQDHVVNYVKAYYIPEADLEQWVKVHEVGNMVICTSLFYGVSKPETLANLSSKTQ